MGDVSCPLVSCSMVKMSERSFVSPVGEAAGVTSLEVGTVLEPPWPAAPVLVCPPLSVPAMAALVGERMSWSAAARPTGVEESRGDVDCPSPSDEVGDAIMLVSAPADALPRECLPLLRRVPCELEEPETTRPTTTGLRFLAARGRVDALCPSTPSPLTLEWEGATSSSSSSSEWLALASLPSSMWPRPWRE